MSDTTDQTKQIQYQLAILPPEVLKLLSDHTDAAHFWTTFFKQHDKKEFESLIKADQFKLCRKPRIIGSTNSYIPWLCGRIVFTETGRKVYVWFELDKWVKFFDKIFVIQLGLVTGVGMVASIFHAVFGRLETEGLIFLMVMGVCWFVRYINKSRGARQTRAYKTAGLQFLERLFEPIKFPTKAEELTVQK
jgi:hypothetical protein